MSSGSRRLSGGNRRRDDRLAACAAWRASRQRGRSGLGCGACDRRAELTDKLVISLRTIKKYVSSVFHKLKLPSTPNESRRVLTMLLFLRS